MSQLKIDGVGEEERTLINPSERPVTWARTFSFALEGVLRTFVHERNMKIHLAAAYAVLLFCLVTRPVLGLVALSGTVCFLVLAAEVFNTAVEALTDLVTGSQPAPLAKAAKDAAAGSVLLTALASVCVGIWVVLSSYPWKFRLFSSLHPAATILDAMILCSITLLWALSYRYLPDAGDDWSKGRRRRPD